MSNAFIHDDFILQTDTARRLYHDVARDLPIVDYHCHLPPQDVAANRRFKDLFEIWLEGDHYKWRAMRTNGTPEKYCTGDASHYEKFLAFSKTVPNALRNPLYHWSHLELKRYFGIDTLLNEETAPAIWEQTNARLKDKDRDVFGILKDFQVEVVCTTDDPVDNLEHHQKAAQEENLFTSMYPTFRPDKLLKIDDVEFFNAYVDKLAEVSDTDVTTFNDLLEALHKRHDFFHDMGCRLSDHGLEYAFATFVPEEEAAHIFDKARVGGHVSPAEKEAFATYIMLYCGWLDADRGWTKQLHVGAQRNNNSRLFKALGPDTGFDSIGDWPQAQRIAKYLDRLDSDNLLPRTIIYNLNPADNYVMGTMIGNYQDGSIAGKVQWGSGWWFLDQKEGMELQMNALSNLGLIGRFVGMLTDSRSFMSYPRHEYFRRIFCNLIGNDVARGELPNDMGMLSDLVRKVCYENARNYFNFVRYQQD